MDTEEEHRQPKILGKICYHLIDLLTLLRHANRKLRTARGFENMDPSEEVKVETKLPPSPPKDTKTVTSKLERLRQNHANDIAKRETEQPIVTTDVKEQPNKNDKNTSSAWCDSEFPASEQSMGAVAEQNVLKKEGAQWCRLPKIPCRHHRDVNGTKKHILFNKTVSANDIRQGMLGTCYFLASLAALCEHPDFLRSLFLKQTESKTEHEDAAFQDALSQGRLLPQSGGAGDEDDVQFYSPSNGAVTVRFCVKGYWTDVTIDDFFICVPSVQNGLPDTPAFARSAGAEIWVMVLEKAFAKLHGSYAAIESGSITDALFALTGCPPFRLDLAGGDTKVTLTNDELWATLLNKHSKGAVVCAAMASYKDPKTGKSIAGEHENDCGLIHGHAYTVLGLHTVKATGQRLLQMRNPWGRGEWNGEWSDGWDGWTPEFKEELGKSDPVGDDEENDGVFFMAFDDVVKHYASLEGTMLGPQCEVPWRHQCTNLTFSAVNTKHMTTAVAFDLSVTEGGTAYFMLGQDGDQNKESGEALQHTPIQANIYRMGCNVGKDGKSTEKMTTVATPMYSGPLLVVGERENSHSVPEALDLKPGKYICVIERSANGEDGNDINLKEMPLMVSACSEKAITMTPHELSIGSDNEDIFTVGHGDGVTHLLYKEYFNRTQQDGTKNVITDQTDPKFVKTDWEFSEGSCVLFTAEKNDGGVPNGVLTCTVTVTGDNIVVHSPETATVDVPEPAEGVAKVTFKISKDSKLEDGFLIIRRKSPGSYKFGMGFQMGFTAGG